MGISDWSSDVCSSDLFLTTSDAALCLWFKESLAGDEQSDFLIRFTDREGLPVAIYPSDLPMRTGRINSRNRFVLGPSGSGKSFCMNALVEQYCLHNMDVVIVDTGDSYSGLCAYYQGKYITYTEKNPITMNPFAMERKEFNLEKKDFLKTLIARSEEHTSELQSLMRISYAVFCLKKKKRSTNHYLSSHIII